MSKTVTKSAAYKIFAITSAAAFSDEKIPVIGKYLGCAVYATCALNGFSTLGVACYVN